VDFFTSSERCAARKATVLPAPHPYAKACWRQSTVAKVRLTPDSRSVRRNNGPASTATPAFTKRKHADEQHLKTPHLREVIGSRMQPEAPNITTFVQLAARDADASRIAEAAVAQWSNIDAALSPIIGQSGVAALFKRSLRLTGVNYPCLHALSESTLRPGDHAGLRAALSQETAFDAAAASDALQRTFHELLANLIGDSLAERLLRSAWNLPSIENGHAAREPAP
jgi:hypothetical protein